MKISIQLPDDIMKGQTRHSGRQTGVTEFEAWQSGYCDQLLSTEYPTDFQNSSCASLLISFVTVVQCILFFSDSIFKSCQVDYY